MSESVIPETVVPKTVLFETIRSDLWPVPFGRVFIGPQVATSIPLSSVSESYPRRYFVNWPVASTDLMGGDFGFSHGGGYVCQIGFIENIPKRGWTLTTAHQAIDDVGERGRIGS